MSSALSSRQACQGGRLHKEAKDKVNIDVAFLGDDALVNAKVVVKKDGQKADKTPVPVHLWDNAPGWRQAHATCHDNFIRWWRRQLLCSWLSHWVMSRLTMSYALPVARNAEVHPVLARDSPAAAQDLHRRGGQSRTTGRSHSKPQARPSPDRRCRAGPWRRPWRERCVGLVSGRESLRKGETATSSGTLS